MAPTGQASSTVETASLPVMRELTSLEEEHRANALAELHSSPASQGLEMYLENLRTGCDYTRWNVETFTEGVRTLANLCGPDRAKYYDNPLKGLNYPTTFTQLWNRAHPQCPITFWDQNFRRQCPAGWTNMLEDTNTGWVIRHTGSKPLSQGLNDLICGPTTLDCGMFCQFVLWMAIRYLMGDVLFDASFKFGTREFVLTQAWDLPLERASNLGNLLYPFYDAPLPRDVSPGLGHQKCIVTKTFYNHVDYLSKHPGGMDKMHNVTKIGESNYIFNPSALSILSDVEMEDMLLDAYNSPRDSADLEKMAIYQLMPKHVHQDFEPKTFGDLAQEVENLDGHEFSKAEWRDGRSERENNAAGLCLIFNFERLEFCFRKALVQHRSGLNVGSPLIEARSLKSGRWIVNGI